MFSGGAFVLDYRSSSTRTKRFPCLGPGNDPATSMATNAIGPPGVKKFNCGCIYDCFRF